MKKKSIAQLIWQLPSSPITSALAHLRKPLEPGESYGKIKADAGEKKVHV